MGIMAFDESDRELLSNLDSKSDRDIELDAYGGNEDFMNLNKEMIEYVCKGRDVFEDMRVSIENSRKYTNPETRHKVEKKLKIVQDICEMIEKLWSTE